MPAKSNLDWTPINLQTSDARIAQAFQAIKDAKHAFDNVVTQVLREANMLPDGSVVKTAVNRDQPAFAITVATGSAKPALALGVAKPTAQAPAPAKAKGK